jgi:hypothetical protein
MKSIIRVKNIEKIREWVNWSINFCFQNDCLQNDCSINNLKEWFFYKPVGLDSRDQSRLRFLDLSRSTFETCRDYPYCRDKIIFFLGQDF